MNSNTRHYQIPAEPGRLRAVALAGLVHLLLLGFLWFGVSWQSDTPIAVEAEIWSPVAREAAPPPPPPPPVPEPVPEPPKVAAVEPPRPVPAPEPVKAKLPDPDIALEKEKQRKKKQQEKEEAKREEAERLKKEKLAEEKAREEEAKRKKLAEAEEKEKEKKKLAELEKKKQAEEQKRKEEAAAEEKRKLAEEQQRKQEEAAAEQRARKRREDDLRRQLGGDGGSGDAEKSMGPSGDAGYLGKIGALIKSNTTFVQRDYPGNPAVKFLIELQPDGQLRGEPRLLHSSGLPAFDAAVRRAIEKSAPFPKNPANGKVPDSLEITQRPKDTDNR